MEKLKKKIIAPGVSSAIIREDMDRRRLLQGNKPAAIEVDGVYYMVFLSEPQSCEELIDYAMKNAKYRKGDKHHICIWEDGEKIWEGTVIR